jgi:serine/threonine protein kinase
MIWYAERIESGMPVVVKVPRRDDEKTGMSFMQEISVWKDLDHPHIATVLSANILPVPYIEIEYLPGSLAELNKPVPFSEALEIIRSLASALVYAHDRGVAHCDIKPSNILLTKENVPKLTDWGLARSGSPRWSVSGFSPRYAAPEQHQLTPDCGFATDIWQTGMVFSELLTGHAEVPSGIEPVFMQKEGVGVLPVLHRCLAPDPHDRYPSARALSEDLDQRFPPGVS